MEADVRITTGFVEPHFFAGFSGGPKMVAPGLAGLETTLELHNARRIGDPRATWGVIEGNPVHDAVRAIAAATGVDFALDVLLERRAADHPGLRRRDPRDARGRPARRPGRRRCSPCERPFDIVDHDEQRLSARPEPVPGRQGDVGGCRGSCARAARSSAPPSAATGCRTTGSYGRLLRRGPSPADLLARIAASPVTIPDQWQVQIQARIQSHARVLLRTDGLSDDAVRAAHLEPIADVGETVASLVAASPGLRIGVLPQGPQTIPYLT